MSLTRTLQRIGLALVALAVFAMPVAAQDEAGPPSDEQFLRGLAEMGLGDLILQIAKDPPGNPEEAAGLRDALIASYLPSLYNNQGVESFFDGVQMIVDYQNKMLAAEANADYWARPIWMADFGQLMLNGALPLVNQAGDFTLVGFPTSTQQRAVDVIVGNAFAQLSRADDEQFRLSAILRADPEFAVKYVNTGHWAQLKQYVDLNIPYYRTWAIVYLLNQPDDSRYFAAQVKAGVEPNTARANLIKRATVDIEGVIGRSDALQLPDDNLARAHALLGHLSIEQGEYDEAITHLDKAASYDEALPYTHLLVGMTRAKALQKAGKTDETVAVIERLRETEAAMNDPFAQVMLADRLFYIRYDQAMTLNDPEKQRPILADAFGVYDELIASDRLGQYKAGIRSFIEERYVDQVPPGVPADKLPPSLRFAKVRGLFNDAQGLEGDAMTAKYQEMIDAADEFLKSPDLSDAVKAQTMYYKGIAQLRTNQAGYALQTLIEVGEQFPESPFGQSAISIAVENIAKPLYANSPDNETIKRLYESALKVLIEKYPNTELAEVNTYFLAAFYRETEQYAKAVEAYTKVPRNHEAYVSAQYEKIACLGALWNDAPAGGAKAVQAQAVIPAVGDFVALADRAQAGLTGQRRQTVRQHAASALLLKATVLLESIDLPDDASRTIDQVEQSYPEIETIKPRILGLRIRVFQKRGEYDRAEQAILEYMRTNPDRAGPLALSVLKSLIDQIESLAAEESPDQAQITKLADVAVNLAENVVLPWADRQADVDEDQRLAYELIPAQAELAAGRRDAALKRFESIISKFGKKASTNIDVISGQAEASYQLDQYGKASRIFNRIIRHYQETGTAKDSNYWHSYMRVMQMVDAQSQGKNADIYLKIRNAERANPDLGGEPYKSTLRSLIDKHAP